MTWSKFLSGLLFMILVVPALAQDAKVDAPAPWSAGQAIGRPDGHRGTDDGLSWASAEADLGPEWLLIKVKEPVTPVALKVYESLNPGALRRIVAITEKGEVELFSGTVPRPLGAGSAIAVIPVTVDVTATTYRIEFKTDNVEGWNEIDTVSILAIDGLTHWPYAAEASSSYESLEARETSTEGPLPERSSLDGMLEVLRGQRTRKEGESAAALAREILSAQRHDAGIPAVEQEPGFAGLWSTTFGRLRLRDAGDGFEGLYAYAGVSSIRGKIEGDRLVFHYKEPKAAGEGWFRLAEGGASFDGQWRKEGDTTWEPWTGSRVESPQKGRRMLVILEAPWESGLDERETSFGQMLRSIFQGTESLEIRHRWFHGEDDFRLWTAELGLLDEPVVLVIASHATRVGIETARGVIPAAVVADALSFAPSVELVHFSACEAMAGDLPDLIFAKRPAADRLQGVSGYTISVDWMGSALTEFVYMDLVLNRNLAPKEAAAELLRAVTFAGERVPEGSEIPASHFRFRAAPKAK